MEICKLCGNEAILKMSHIIPRSYYKRLKRESGQLLLVSSSEEEPKLTNSDPKERLLCGDCEQFLSSNYEVYGTVILRRSENVIKNDDHIVINGFDYKRTYLFFISILWRASLSIHPTFQAVLLEERLQELLRQCIFSNSLKISMHTNLRLDHFFRLSVVRIVDSTGNIPDEVIRSIISNFRMEHGTDKCSMIYYFMLDGFLVTYVLSVGKDLHDIRAKRLSSQLVSGSSARINKVEVNELKEIAGMFNMIIDKRKSSGA
ncbi:hypothetical protein LQ759_15010 [Serratia marcescens]|uniref:hypothetical protein n=1 Tax=Serratia marcescens TaxID=615 RepID=UPI001F1F71B1|nr:hypothetical protein [Serratia marcescens]HEO9035869.1 hypothetical protein [Serratia marcescens]